LLSAPVCKIEKHHGKGKRATKLATFVRKSFAMHAHHTTRETTNNAHNASGQKARVCSASSSPEDSSGREDFPRVETPRVYS
jgi:hypothetical protein